MPPPAPTEFQLFCKEEYESIKEAINEGKYEGENYNKTAKELFSKISEEKLNSYKTKREELVKDFKKKMRQFNKYGYFKITNKNEEKLEKHIKKKRSDEDRDRRRREAREKKKSQKSEESKSKSRSKSRSKSKSKSKRQSKKKADNKKNKKTKKEKNKENKATKEKGNPFLETIKNTQNENDIKVINKNSSSSIDVVDED